MAIEIRKALGYANKVSAIINAILLAVVTGNVTNPKEIRNAKFPLAANVVLLLFLSLGLIAATYKLWV